MYCSSTMASPKSRDLQVPVLTKAMFDPLIDRMGQGIHATSLSIRKVATVSVSSIYMEEETGNRAIISICARLWVFAPVLREFAPVLRAKLPEFLWFSTTKHIKTLQSEFAASGPYCPTWAAMRSCRRGWPCRT